jgi:hypothetical protein
MPPVLSSVLPVLLLLDRLTPVPFWGSFTAIPAVVVAVADVDGVAVAADSGAIELFVSSTGTTMFALGSGTVAAGAADDVDVVLFMVLAADAVAVSFSTTSALLVLVFACYVMCWSVAQHVWVIEEYGQHNHTSVASQCTVKACLRHYVCKRESVAVAKDATRQAKSSIEKHCSIDAGKLQVEVEF